MLDHLAASKPNSKKQSALADHCRTLGHDIWKAECKLLHACSKSRYLNKLEEAETIAAASSTPNELLNDLDAVYVNPLIRYYYNFNHNYS